MLLKSPSRRKVAIVCSTGLSVIGMSLLPMTVASASPSPAKQKVTASLTEFHIALSKKSFKPGRYTFLVKNNGKVVHALAISGPGVKNQSSPDLTPGKSTTLSVTLKKGTYDFYCPIPGHKALGMNLNVTVESGGGASTTAVTTEGATSGGGVY